MPGTGRISKRSELAVALLLAAASLQAQPQQALLIDRIIAVVGDEALLYSDLAQRLEQAKQGGERVAEGDACRQLEDMMYEKLLLDQGRIDSVQVDEAQVQAELDRRIRYFVSQLGSEQKLEEFYGKTITEIKSEFHDQIADQLMVQQMQQTVVGDVRVTPREVQRFFDRIPADSVPLINAEVEFAQIVRIPKATEDEERRVRRKLEEFRADVLSGKKDFCVLAMLYSEDPGSKDNCGELGLVPQGVMVPEFDAVAMSLKENEVSQVFKTQYGYHLMQMIERRGEQYNARHILIKPQVGEENMQAARNFLDSIATEVRLGRIDFGEAAAQFSDDEESKGNHGVVIEPNSNSARWAMGDLDQQDFFVIDKLKLGEISDPVSYALPDGGRAYRIIRLAVRTEPHRATMKTDYQLLQQAAESEFKQKAVDDWVKEKSQETHVHVAEAYVSCPFHYPWLKAKAE
jgi:peptidyl-prolyl cis-trans isomerase SurA